MEITKFFEDDDVFITGGSGSVGKALIERLLSTCRVRRVFVLMREKRGCDAEKRLGKLLKDKIFRKLKANDPTQLDKVQGVPGDAMLPLLGISAPDLEQLKDVSVVFHCAATIRFDEPLRLALLLNVGGTLEALRLSEGFQKLKVFVHVSTYFSNPYLEYTEPKYYESPMDWRSSLKLAMDKDNEEILEFLSKKVIVGFPNTYTFTKNLSESVVNDFYKRLPVVVYRPSIVLAALENPEPGFPPSMIGAMGLTTLVYAGILKTVFINPEVRLDLTPQDGCINVMLYAASKAANDYKTRVPQTLPVYLFSSMNLDRRSFMQIGLFSERLKLWNIFPFEKSFLIPGCRYTSSALYYKFLVFTKEVFPALLGDCLLRLFGQKPVLMGIIRKAFTTLKVLEPFMFNQYESPGVTDIDNFSKITEGTEFDLLTPFSKVQGEGFNHILLDTVYMIREVLLNEDPSTIRRARVIHKIKQAVYNLFCFMMGFFLFHWLYNRYKGLFVEV